MSAHTLPRFKTAIGAIEYPNQCFKVRTLVEKLHHRMEAVL